MTTETRPPDQLRPHPLNAEIYGAAVVDDDFRQTIAADGIITPLTIDQHDTIISGHRRWQAARDLGLDFVPVVVQQIDGPNDALRLLLVANVQREKSYSQRMREADEWDGIVAAYAHSRMVEGGKHYGRGMGGEGGSIGLGHLAQPYSDDQAETPTRYAARRDRTYRRERYIWRTANGRLDAPESIVGVARELVKKLDDRSISVSRAEQDLREDEAKIGYRATTPRDVVHELHDENEPPATYPASAAPEWQPALLSEATYTAAEEDTDPESDRYSLPAAQGTPPQIVTEAQRALDTIAAGRLPLPPERLAALERARSEQATSDAYLAATKDAATTRAEHRAIFFRAVRIIKEQTKACPPEQVLRSLQEGDDQAAHWFLDDLDTWSREMRAALPRRLRLASGERG